MATLNIGLKVNRAITGATTVNANAVAIVTYIAAGTGAVVTGGGVSTTNAAVSVNRIFGPGQSVPASFTTTEQNIAGGGGSMVSTTKTFTLQSGVEFINTQ